MVVAAEINFNKKFHCGGRSRVRSDIEQAGGKQRPSGPTSALSLCRNAFVAVGVFSGALNILLLSGSMFMLQVYDRVLPSRSVPTLVGLVVIVTVLYAFQGLLDLIRTRILVRVARDVDDVLSTRGL